MRTGGIYGDFGLFTCRESFGEDVTELFNMLTGYTRPRRFRHLLVAPTGLRDGFHERIRREAEHARHGRPARIVAKMNSLVDRSLIEDWSCPGLVDTWVKLPPRPVRAVARTLAD